MQGRKVQAWRVRADVGWAHGSRCARTRADGGEAGCDGQSVDVPDEPVDEPDDEPDDESVVEADDDSDPDDEELPAEDELLEPPRLSVL